ncbi:MAG: hypothetical protein JNM99_21040 [Verrucomicrobiaceae bacterium]|nr:hypothetical protein [Verrucomicrobiaceae bacterium]
MSDQVHPSQLTKPPGAVAVDTDCVGCVHYRDNATCPPYPQGVPLAVFSGAIRHDRVLADQIGELVFQPRLDFEVEWLDADGHPVE